MRTDREENMEDQFVRWLILVAVLRPSAAPITAVELIANSFTSIAFMGTGQTHARDCIN